jgi:acyl-coenzyme A thioesterase PaaI-like protein
MPAERYMSQLDALDARSEVFAYTPEQVAVFLESFNKLAGLAYMGGTVSARGQTLVCVELASLQEHHRGGLGTRAVNGAVISGLFDCGLGVAGLLQFPGKRCGTAELSVKFLRPVLGEQVRVYAATIKAADNVAFVEGMLFSGNALCATASGMVATSGGKAVTGR